MTGGAGHNGDSAQLGHLPIVIECAVDVGIALAVYEVEYAEHKVMTAHQRTHPLHVICAVMFTSLVAGLYEIKMRKKCSLGVTDHDIK